MFVWEFRASPRFLKELRVCQFSFAASGLIWNLKVGEFIFCGRDDDIWVMISSNFSGNQQCLTNTGGVIFLIRSIVILDGDLLMISLVILFGFGASSPGVVNMGSSERGFGT